ncbi:MAG: response regulator transcription factor [Clostridiales bacterium]|nr:response regulator transcription factor [Clostridiales bacterium]
MAKILIVEDDLSIRLMIKMHLSLVGHAVFEAGDANEAREILKKESIDLALLDIMLPGEDGFSIGENLIPKGMSVLFLTARTALSDRLRGLTMGAEDYILKPFEPAELLARIENILKRNAKEEKVFKSGDIEIDFQARTVYLKGENVNLTALEFDLLSMLAKRRNIAIHRDELLNTVWGYNYVGETRTVDVHIQRLRAKIGEGYIETVYKYGYRFSGRQK